MAKSSTNSSSETMEQMKNQAASEVGVTLKDGNNGDLTARQAGSIGGQMVNIICPQLRIISFDRIRGRTEYSVTYHLGFGF